MLPSPARHGPRPPPPPNRPPEDRLFLEGLTALEALSAPAAGDGRAWTPQLRRRHLDAAIAAFRALVAAHPRLVRPRLELARALFQRGDCNRPVASYLEHWWGDDCGNAARHFRRVLAGDPHPLVVAAVARHLSAIRERRRLWTYFEAGLLPDSNVAAATSARVVHLFGLPFLLDPEARASSGLGLMLAGGSEWRQPLGAAAHAPRLRTGVRLRSRDHRGARFDALSLSLHAGVSFPRRGREFSILPVAKRLWYGGRTHGHAFGLRGEAGWRVSPRLAVSATAAWLDWRHARSPRLDGPET